MVQVQGDRDTSGVGDGGLYQLHQIDVFGVFPCAGGDLQNYRGIELGSRFGNALDNLHVVDVERADGIPAIVSLFEHFGCGDQWHDNNSFL